MDQARFAFQARVLGGPLSLQVKLDNSDVFDQELTDQWQIIGHEFDDVDDTAHTITISLRDKQLTHTQVNEAGDIVADRVVEIQNFAFDDVMLGHVFVEHAVYQHNYNGHGPAVKEQFFGTMGCNGTVTLQFQGPLYLWLLEHM